MLRVQNFCMEKYGNYESGSIYCKRASFLTKSLTAPLLNTIGKKFTKSLSSTSSSLFSLFSILPPFLYVLLFPSPSMDFLFAPCPIFLLGITYLNPLALTCWHWNIIPEYLNCIFPINSTFSHILCQYSNQNNKLLVFV